MSEMMVIDYDERPLEAFDTTAYPYKSGAGKKKKIIIEIVGSDHK